MKKVSIMLAVLLAALFISNQHYFVKADDNDGSSQQTTTTDNNQSSDNNNGNGQQTTTTTTDNDQSSDNNNGNGQQTTTTTTNDNNQSSDNNDSNNNSNRPAKTMVVHYQTLDGKTISSDKTITTTGKSVFMRGDGGDSAVKLIKGYIRYHAYKSDYSYNNLPSSITIQYVKDTTATKQMAKYYMKYLNDYRKKHGLKKLKNSPALDKKANVRSKELLTDFSHTRPNGTSYNTKNSGYAEVILGIGPYYTGPDNTLNYQYTGEQNAFYLLNEDAIHRDTLLNKWANYGTASFRLTTTNFVMCGLFSINK